MSTSEESPPLSPSLLYPKKRRRKLKIDKSTQTEQNFVCFIKSGESENDLTAVINLPDAKFFNQRPRDPRNEYFASLIAFEMESVSPNMRSVLYMKIIDLIYHARGNSTEVQGEIGP